MHFFAIPAPFHAKRALGRPAGFAWNGSSNSPLAKLSLAHSPRIRSIVMQHFLLTLCVLSLTPLTQAGEDGFTERISLAPGGGQGNDASGTGPAHGLAMTPDARYVAMVAAASNLVPGDTNGIADIFRVDLSTGLSERMNLGPAGVQSNGQCYFPRISTDGNFVVWNGGANNLVPGDTNGFEDVFLRDVVAGTTELVSVNNSGVQGNFSSQSATITRDGRYVAFWSAADNLWFTDTNGTGDIFLRDRLLNRTLAITILPSGTQANANSAQPFINGLGTKIAFRTTSNNLVAGDTNGVNDIMLADVGTNSVVRIGQPAFSQSNGASSWPTLSENAQFVAFESEASNLVPNDTNGVKDIFVQNLSTGQITRVSVDSSGAQSNGLSETAWISNDGQHVVFSSLATNLVANDTNGHEDVFIHRLATGETSRVSTSIAPLGNGNQISFYPCVSEDGQAAVFGSSASNMITGDSNGTPDVFMRTWPAPPQVVCTGDYPGAPCPCGNVSPGGTGVGCRNSTAVGAGMGWSGTTSVSADSLAITGNGLVPSAPALLFTGPNLLGGGSGVAFGDGLLCVGGPIIRVGVDIPDGFGNASWGPGLGTTIGWTAGETRYVQIWYRDVPGPCGSGFNTSSALEVVLAP